MSKCWTCRRRRLKCDGGIPHCQKCLSNGVECLGYKKPLTWVEGVACRGPMKNRNFGETQDGQAVALLSPTRTDSSLGSSCESVPTPITDPLFQDMDNLSRFFVDYFSKRFCPIVVLKDHEGNRYRGIIPFINSSPMVASAITTVAACHFTHSLTGTPVAGLRGQPSQPPATMQRTPHTLSQGALINFYLLSKARCLKLLSDSLADPERLGDESTFITVVLLALLDVFESGSGSWNFHLEGAKKLLEAGFKSGNISWEGDQVGLLHEIILFQAFGSSLARPGVLSSVSDFKVPAAAVASSISPIGCPDDIVLAVEELALQRRSDAMPNTRVLQDTLALIRQCDVPEWATRMSLDESSAPYEDLLHLGTIWKLSAEIYACRILRNFTGDTNEALPAVEALISEFAFLEREDDELCKCLIWPTFIAGASSIGPASRDWAILMLDRIWRIALCANTRNAAQVLTKLWEKQDQNMPTEDWNWLGELSQLEGSWLFV